MYGKMPFYQHLEMKKITKNRVRSRQRAKNEVK